MDQNITTERHQQGRPAPISAPMHPPLHFTKCHTNGNDFIIVESSSLDQIPDTLKAPTPVLARILCNRTTGIGGDGLSIVSLGTKAGSISAETTDNSITVDLWNSDGSKAEISGNGTCCVAAFVMRDLPGVVDDRGKFTACTGAGRRGIQYVRGDRSGRGNQFHFVVDMGVPIVEEACADIQLQSSTESVKATIMNVGNPQCAIFHKENVPQNWKAMSREIANDSRFPDGVNISFSRVLDRHTLLTVFFERGAGETSSSGTGSIGAAVAAIVRGVAESPVTILSASGGLKVMWEGPGSIVDLEGHADVVAKGEFFGSLSGK